MDGGWVGLWSSPPWWSIVIGQGPKATAAMASAQQLAARPARARPVGSLPSCHAKPATWKPSQPITQLICGSTGMPAKRAASASAKSPTSPPTSRQGRARNQRNVKGASAVSIV